MSSGDIPIASRLASTDSGFVAPLSWPFLNDSGITRRKQLQVPACQGSSKIPGRRGATTGGGRPSRWTGSSRAGAVGGRCRGSAVSPSAWRGGLRPAGRRSAGPLVPGHDAAPGGERPRRRGRYRTAGQPLHFRRRGSAGGYLARSVSPPTSTPTARIATTASRTDTRPFLSHTDTDTSGSGGGALPGRGGSGGLSGGGRDSRPPTHNPSRARRRLVVLRRERRWSSRSDIGGRARPDRAPRRRPRPRSPRGVQRRPARRCQPVVGRPIRRVNRVRNRPAEAIRPSRASVPRARPSSSGGQTASASTSLSSLTFASLAFGPQSSSTDTSAATSGAESGSSSGAASLGGGMSGGGIADAGGGGGDILVFPVGGGKGGHLCPGLAAPSRHAVQRALRRRRAGQPDPRRRAVPDPQHR